MQGKTVVLGSAGWQVICDPWFAQAGLEPGSIKYVEAGNGWAQALAQGKGDAALSWEGLRAQWKGQGLNFDYVLGRSFSRFPANSFVIRAKDFADSGKKALYEQYLRGWAMGLEYGHQNPRAATHIVMLQFPGLASQMTPPVATESMMQLANVFRGDFAKRKGWGWHDMDSWGFFFKTIHDIGQISTSINPQDVIKNDYVAAANGFDAAKVNADADGYKLPPEYATIDVEAIRAVL
jgi:NitT/TauT family transport system substrate-binding protein